MNWVGLELSYTPPMAFRVIVLSMRDTAKERMMRRCHYTHGSAHLLTQSILLSNMRIPKFLAG
jgi:hypothetical protein